MWKKYSVLHVENSFLMLENITKTKEVESVLSIADNIIFATSKTMKYFKSNF